MFTVFVNDDWEKCFKVTVYNYIQEFISACCLLKCPGSGISVTKHLRYYELWPPDFSIITITISQDFSGQRVFRNRQLNFSSSNNHQGCKAGQADRHVKNWNATFTVDFYASITAPPSDRRQASTWQVADQITVAGPAVFPRGRIEQQNSGEQFRKACCCLRHPCILHEGRPEVFRLGWYYVKWKKKSVKGLFIFQFIYNSSTHLPIYLYLSFYLNAYVCKNIYVYI